MTDGLHKGERWWVHTEQARESHRTGLGEQSLRETLEHLRQRGDTSAVVDREQGGRSTVALQGENRLWTPTA